MTDVPERRYEDGHTKILRCYDRAVNTGTLSC